MPLVADNTTILLLLGSIGLFLLHLSLQPGSPLAHPILLGRQGESAKVRNKGESAIWTNALATAGLLVASSSASVKGVKHILSADVKLVAKLRSLVSEEHGAVVVMLENEELAGELISAAMQVEGLHLVLIQPSFVEDVPALFAQLKRPLKAIISFNRLFVRMSLPMNCKLVPVDGGFIALESLPEVQGGEWTVEPRAVVISAAVMSSEGKAVLLELTNQSLTASAHAVSQLLGASNHHKFNSSDSIISFYSILSPFGLSIYLSSCLTKSNFTSTTTKELSDTLSLLQKATIASIPTGQLAPVIKHLSVELQQSTNAWTNKQIWSGKLTALRNGNPQHKIWDASFSPLTRLRSGYSLRAVLTFASTPEEVLTQAQVDATRILLAPTVHGSRHWQSPSPLTASLMHDFQCLSKRNEGMQVGPPVNNVQVKLLLEGEGEEMLGELVVDGPGVVGGWLRTGWGARLLPNGTIKLLK